MSDEVDKHANDEAKQGIVPKAWVENIPQIQGFSLDQADRENI